MNHIICIKSALAADILPKIVFVSCEQVIEAFLNNCVPTITDLWGWMRTELNCSTFLKTTPPPSLACRWAKLRCFGAATQSQADCLGNLITAYFWRMPLSLSRIKGRWICEWAYHLERLGTIWIVLSSYFFTEQRGEEALRGVSQSQTSSGLRATAVSSHLESAYIKAVNYCHSPRATVSLVLIEITYCLLRTEARKQNCDSQMKHSRLWCSESLPGKQQTICWHVSQFSDMWLDYEKKGSWVIQWGKRISFESLQNTILSPAMWVLKLEMLMRLVFVTLSQNSNPKGSKK